MKSLSFSGYVVCGTVVRVVAAVVVSIAHGPVLGHFPLYINQQNTRAVGVDFSVQRKCPHLQPDTFFFCAVFRPRVMLSLPLGLDTC